MTSQEFYPLSLTNKRELQRAVQVKILASSNVFINLLFSFRPKFFSSVSFPRFQCKHYNAYAVIYIVIVKV